MTQQQPDIDLLGRVPLAASDRALPVSETNHECVWLLRCPALEQHSSMFGGMIGVGLYDGSRTHPLSLLHTYASPNIFVLHAFW